MDQPQTVTAYDRLGGDPWVRRFVARFYDLMETLPEAAPARAIHPDNLFDARQKLYEYLTGWLGGPPLFVSRHGAPMLRSRHLHAPIDDAEVAGWLACFHQAWRETVDDAEVTALIVPRIEALALHMKNT